MCCTTYKPQILNDNAVVISLINLDIWAASNSTLNPSHQTGKQFFVNRISISGWFDPICQRPVDIGFFQRITLPQDTIYIEIDVCVQCILMSLYELINN